MVLETYDGRQLGILLLNFHFTRSLRLGMKYSSRFRICLPVAYINIIKKVFVKKMCFVE